MAPFVSISPDALDSQSGIGNVRVFTKYQIYKKDGKAKTLRGLIKLTETFPTGNSTNIPALGTGAYQTTIEPGQWLLYNEMGCLRRI